MSTGRSSTGLPPEAMALRGREKEYLAVLAFAEERLTLQHTQTLFVFGACGCGKTTTVTRALRRISHAAMLCDRGSNTAGAQGAANPAAAEVYIPLDAMPFIHERELAKSLDRCQSSATRDGPRRSAAAAKRTTGDDGDNATVEPKRLFPLNRLPARFRRVQGHYINCADLNAQQLCDELCRSLRSSGRPSAELRELVDVVGSLPQFATTVRTSGGGDSARYHLKGTTAGAEAVPIGAEGAGAAALLRSKLFPSQHEVALESARDRGKAALPTTLHVLALDEVEYLKAPARSMLSHLVTLSILRPAQVALVMVSNSRELAHVPASLLRELPFESYTVAELKRIGANIVATGKRERTDSTAETERSASSICHSTQAAPIRRSGRLSGAASAPGGESTSPAAASAVDNAGGSPVPLPPATSTAVPATETQYELSDHVLEYVARTALLTHSGDVRQVQNMCAGALNAARRGDAARREATSSLSTPGAARLSSSSSRSSSSMVSDAAAAAAPAKRRRGEAVDGKAKPAAVKRESATEVRVVSLAQSMPVFRDHVANAVDDNISRMPDHMLYVLSCIVTMARRPPRGGAVATVDATLLPSRRGAAAAGRVAPFHVAGVSTSPVTLREVHGLYVALMKRRHYPLTSGAHVAMFVDALADLGILTRPQQKGNERVFALNGTWSVEQMQAAIARRGEALRLEMAACGQDGSQNPFATVLSELHEIAGGW